MKVEIETAILKHKWDSMGQDDEPEETEITEEERRENERVAQLAEMLELNCVSEIFFLVLRT